MTSADVLTVTGLTVAFKSRAVVDDVSFALGHGRVLALVGESGSGKTISAMSALGLLPPGARATGSITLEGEELLGADPELLRKVRGGRIGTVFQEPMSAFNPVHRIGRQIAEAIRAHGGPPGRSALRARVFELLRSAGLTDPERVARAHPHELSGGQLQRAMIAMAISCDPVALIADEPTTALDVTVQAGILDLLRSLRDRHGTAVLLITHDMGVVADLADDVVVMKDGRVEERGDTATLFGRPKAAYTKALLEAVPRLDRARSVAVPHETEVVAAADQAQILYGRTVAVEGASFRIAPGRTFGLVGESGSGKSTLARAFAGLVPIRSGSITVGGLDLARAPRKELRRVRGRIGYVFQDPASSLDPRFTVGRAIAEPMRLSGNVPPADRRTRVAELLDQVRLPASYAERYPHELSGGQRQRVAIARAIALRPALLIADEPTSALDVSVQARVLEVLSDLQRELGFACLFISHDLAVVQSLAHEVAVMHAGRIVESGPAARVLSSPREAYTKRLLAAAPVADPDAQRRRREAVKAS